jgi:hypothetical protein
VVLPYSPGEASRKGQESLRNFFFLLPLTLDLATGCILLP